MIERIDDGAELDLVEVADAVLELVAGGESSAVDPWGKPGG